MKSKLPKVCVVGRPNVGKSTLFNVLTHSRDAIVDDRPGVTRDYLEKTVFSQDGMFAYKVVDTGGYEGPKSQLQPFEENLVWEQTETALKAADLLVFVMDAKVGLHPEDMEFYRLLIRYDKPMLFVVNKAEGKLAQESAVEFYKLGIDKIHAISSAHNYGIKDLRSLIEKTLIELQKNHPIQEQNESVQLAIVGRPNVGKSSLLNRLIGERRALVSPVPGTTRDPVDGLLSYKGVSYQILDTAGMRRRARIHEKVEVISSIKSYHSIQDADIVVVIIDAQRGLEDQDLRILRLAAQEYKPLVIAVNKWDLISHKTTQTQEEWRKAILHKLGDIGYVPIHFMSCLENQRVHALMDVVAAVNEQRQKRVNTALINEVLSDITTHHSPALIKAFVKKPKFYYATQVMISPPTIVIKCNIANKIQPSYRRYMCNQLRERLGFDMIQPRIIFRDKNHAKEE